MAIVDHGITSPTMASFSFLNCWDSFRTHIVKPKYGGSLTLLQDINDLRAHSSPMLELNTLVL